MPPITPLSGYTKGVGKGGGVGQAPQLFERGGGGGATYPLPPPPNNPPTFSFNFYVKQEKIKKCTKLRGMIIINVTNFDLI